ncbi:MscS Mechanosensitive ion channel [Methanosalsum zhilinae DSM 4017]|uniref:MscS Mechanosensitive ion channel n=1 Tax=Methanosalsum zhilinae (strain DSM 4017 / NBRC 107636 / OCM 62 / WeN5) TaxID=679901 RepID=F7XM19_METZD|nr:mechanosensitive ion channel family protein [Methanosalsum zhilinae]AEH61206.1 MscS Mechanosensitive ion channel [Methanosalsum zhilinae DSM 4017]
MDSINLLPSWLTWDFANFFVIIFIIVITIVAANLVNRMLHAYFRVVSKKMEIDETVYALVRRIIIAMIYLGGIITIIMTIPVLRNISLALFAGAGFAGIVVGLAAQNTLSNIIAGIALATFRPFRVGDLVTIRDEYGRVADITLGYTVVTTWDNRRLYIPNHIISDEAIINWSIEDPTVLWPVDVGISYDSNIDLARKLMLEEAQKHPRVMTADQLTLIKQSFKMGDEMSVLVTELGDFAVNLRLFVWIADRSNAYGTGCELRESIKKRFDAEGVEIPFPYRTVVYKKDLPAPKKEIEGK